MSKNRMQIFKRILQLSFQEPIYMSAAVLLSAISALAYFIPYLVLYMLLSVLLGSYPNISAIDSRLILKLGFTAFAGAAINVLAYFGALICSHIAAFHTSYSLKIEFANHLSKLPLGFHITTGTGKMRGVMDGNIDKIQSFIAHKIPDMISSLIYPAAMIVLMLKIDYRFGAACAFGIVLAYVFHYRSMGKGGAKHMMDLYLDALDKMNNASVEYVRGITVIKSFGRTAKSFRKLHDSIHDYTNMVIPYTRNWEKYMCWFEVLISSIYLFLIPVGMIVFSTATDYPSFAINYIFYLILAPSIASVIPKIGGIMDECMRVNGEIERMDEIMRQPPLHEITTSVPPDGFDIRFVEVDFSYKARGTQKNISGVSFTARPNSVTALVGPSGSGKSTIASLIARFWDVDAGRIEIGGVDIRAMPVESLMEKISFVFQNDYLFSQSIRDNIGIGNSGATLDEIVAAAKAANCHEFISRLPNGYDTVLGQNDIHLSGGETQRIALARAFLKNAPIIILDEATASQDIESESLIQDALSRLIQGKTVIMVAHRLSTIRNADKIIVLKDGMIAEQGCHNDLINAGGLYSKMWSSYSKALNWHLGGRNGEGQ